jgi:hypothetical protein
MKTLLDILNLKIHNPVIQIQCNLSEPNHELKQNPE